MMTFEDYAEEETWDKLEFMVRDSWGLNIDDCEIEPVEREQGVFTVKERGCNHLLFTINFINRTIAEAPYVLSKERFTLGYIERF